MTHHNLAPVVPPISTRNTTDLGEKCEIGVDDRIEAQYNTSPPVHAAVTRDDVMPLR